MITMLKQFFKSILTSKVISSISPLNIQLDVSEHWKNAKQLSMDIMSCEPSNIM